jgi:hypothetical protein
MLMIRKTGRLTCGSGGERGSTGQRHGERGDFLVKVLISSATEFEAKADLAVESLSLMARQLKGS